MSYNGTGPAPINSMSNKTIIAAWLFGVLFLASTMGLIWQFKKMQSLKLENYNLTEERKLGQEKKSIETDQDLMSRISEIMIMPEDKPTILGVKDIQSSDAAKPFYKNAANGDKVLLFRDRAILFRPSDGRIINMVGLDSLSDLPLSNSSSTSTPTNDIAIQNDQVSTVAVSAPAAASTIEIRNGTATSGLASSWRTKMTEKGYKVLAIGNAANDKYAETMIINPSGKTVTELEQIFGVVSVSNLPSGESASQAEVLIILGTK